MIFPLKKRRMKSVNECAFSLHLFSKSLAYMEFCHPYAFLVKCPFYFCTKTSAILRLLDCLLFPLRESMYSEDISKRQLQFHSCRRDRPLWSAPRFLPLFSCQVHSDQHNSPNKKHNQNRCRFQSCIVHIHKIVL